MLDELARQQVGRAHAGLLAVCDAVEIIADSLPDQIDRQTCLHLARTVCSIVDGANRTEENVLFPLVERLQRNLREPASFLEHPRFEHVVSLYSVEDLSETLMAVGRGDCRQSPGEIGYMCRCFFENLRRHVAYERDLLMPMLIRPDINRSALAIPADRAPSHSDCPQV